MFNLKDEDLKRLTEKQADIRYRTKALMIFTILLLAMLALGIIGILKVDRVMKEQIAIRQSIERLERPVTVDLTDENEEMDAMHYDDLGDFEITHYCPCSKCCGKSDGITATGVKAQANHTIAIDPEVIPYGTLLLIDGIEYVAEDCGGAIKGNRLDIYCDSHEEALSRGRIWRSVQRITVD